MRTLLCLCLIFGMWSCKKAKKSEANSTSYTEVEIKYAEGFSIQLYPNFTKVIVHSPWQNAENDMVYLLVKNEQDLPKSIGYDAVIKLPIQHLVSTSTTHIPSLITLNQLDKLVGFPNLNYISSEAARKRIEDGHIKELGKNEVLNTEVLLSVDPGVVFGFSVGGQNKTLRQLEDFGIPVVYNGDWLEEDVLGKAEWIKFFGVFLGELETSITAFENVESAYNSIKEKAKSATKTPTVLAGAMYQDRWYLPYGSSWQAQFFEDANTDYLFKNTKGSGSAAFSFETVLDKAKTAEFWISPGQYTSYHQLLESNSHYKEFDAFQDKNIFTMASTTGETGGVLFYELGPNRPDLVLKDLVKIFHPDLIKDKEFTFFKPLSIE